MLDAKLGETSLPTVQFGAIHDPKSNVIESWPMLIELIAHRFVVLVESDDEATWLMHKNYHDAIVQIGSSSAAQAKHIAIPLGAFFHVGDRKVEMGN